MTLLKSPRNAKKGTISQRCLLIVTIVFLLMMNQKSHALWTTPDFMDFSSDSAMTPVFALDSNSGVGMAAFIQKNITTRLVYARRYQIDSGWVGAAEPLSISGQNASNLSIGYLGSGEFMVLYQKSNDNYERIISRVFNGTSWLPVDTVCNLSIYSSDAPTLSTDGNGHALAAWQQHDGTEQTIFARYFIAGSWQAINDISETVNASYCNADVDVYLDGGGAGFAVFVQNNTVKSKTLIYGTRWNGSSWVDLACLSADSNIVENKPKVVIEGSTNAMVIYESGNDLYSVKYVGAWQTPSVVDNGAESTLLETELVHISGSQYMAIYRQNLNIWAAYFNGSSWETPIQIDANAGSAFTPDIAFHYSGRGLAVFEDNQRIYANWFEAGGWGTPMLIDANPNDAANPCVQFNKDGTAVIAFTQFDGTNSRIYNTVYYEQKKWDNANDNMNWNDPMNWH